MTPPVINEVQVDHYLTIFRLANGWQVTLSRPYRSLREESGRQISEGMSATIREMLPFFKQLMKMREEDPLLASLQQQEKEDPDLPPAAAEPTPLISKEEYSFIFTSFEDVLEFLNTTFNDLIANGE